MNAAALQPVCTGVGLAEFIGVVGMLLGFGASAVGVAGLVHDAVTSFAARLPGPPPPPVKITRAGDASGRCPVCAERVIGAAVQCPGCRVPTHADCWSYQGGCGIYACAFAVRR